MVKKYGLVIAFLGLLTSCAPVPAPVQEIQIIQAEERTVTASGRGEVKVAPDVAEVIFTITTWGKEVDPARVENNDIAREVLEVLKVHHIQQQDIKVGYISITTDDYGSYAQVGRYETSNEIMVTVHDLLKLELITTEVLKLGKVRMEGVYFRITELEKYHEEARKLALQSAKENAQMLATELGQKIDQPISIIDLMPYPGTGGDFDYFSLTGSRYGRDMTVFGEIMITSNINVTFSLTKMDPASK